MALLVCSVRLIKGPTTADRVVSFDASCCCYVYCWRDERYFNSVSYLDSIMLIAIISFVSSVSISRFIGKDVSSMEIIKTSLVSLLRYLFS